MKKTNNIIKLGKIISNKNIQIQASIYEMRASGHNILLSKKLIIKNTENKNFNGTKRNKVK